MKIAEPGTRQCPVDLGHDLSRVRARPWGFG